jgi:hypothetical protein
MGAKHYAPMGLNQPYNGLANDIWPRWGKSSLRFFYCSHHTHHPLITNYKLVSKVGSSSRLGAGGAGITYHSSFIIHGSVITHHSSLIIHDSVTQGLAKFRIFSANQPRSEA